MLVAFRDDDADYRAVREEVLRNVGALLTAPLTGGGQVDAFESELAAYTGTSYAIGVGTGTDALYLALRACGVTEGDEVITVANGDFTTVEAVLRLGATPVLIDVSPENGTIDPGELPGAMSSRVRAVLPVHLYGRPADMPAVLAFANGNGLAVVEDARDACGATLGGRFAGSFGDAAAFSFGPGRPLGSFGDGGAVTTNSRAAVDLIRQLTASDDHERTHLVADIRLPSRLDQIHAAILRPRLRVFDDNLLARRRNAGIYEQLLQSADVKVPGRNGHTLDANSDYPVRVSEFTRDHLLNTLGALGIQARVGWSAPANLHPAARSARVVGDLRVTRALAGEVLLLPMRPSLTQAELSYVAEGVTSWLARQSRVAGSAS
jgi:dTDP-4-amino-4,6-dideoxygalactose transaminase